LQAGAQIGVGVQEARAKGFQRLFDLFGQLVAGNLAFFGARVAPAFQRAIGGGIAGLAKA